MSKSKNIMEKIKKIKVNPYYDIRIKEVDEICNNSKSSFDLFRNAFIVGYMRDMKAARTEMKKGGVVNG